MKTIKLQLAERFAALAVFNDPNVKVKTESLKSWIDDAAKFPIRDEEKTVVEWVEDKDDKGTTIAVRWNPSKDEGKDIEISEFSAQLLQDILSGKEISAADPLANPIISLLEKLK